MRIASRLYEPSRDTSIVSSPAAATTRSGPRLEIGDQDVSQPRITQPESRHGPLHRRGCARRTGAVRRSDSRTRAPETHRFPVRRSGRRAIRASRGRSRLRTRRIGRSWPFGCDDPGCSRSLVSLPVASAWDGEQVRATDVRVDSLRPKACPERGITPRARRAVAPRGSPPARRGANRWVRDRSSSRASLRLRATTRVLLSAQSRTSARSRSLDEAPASACASVCARSTCARGSTTS